jgi:crossover junction endodeoxyribonuclease RusA
MLTLPYPPSANRYWRTYMPKGFKAPVTTLSPEAKEFKEAVRKRAMVARTKPIDGLVVVQFTLHPHRPLDWVKRVKVDPHNWDSTVQCIDLDNACKVLMDALKGVAFGDDSLVRRIVAERALPDEHGARVEVMVTPFVRSGDCVQPQLELA